MEKVQIQTKCERNFGFLNANLLKIVALVAMTIDHIGVIFFADQMIFRIIGRIAFPIFAFFVAEGTKHTRNKLRYFLVIFLLGVVCEIFARVFAGIEECNILLTFSVSILLVYLLEYFKDKIHSGDAKQSSVGAILFLASVGVVFVLSDVLPKYVDWYGGFDYGFFGILVPVMVAVFDKHFLKVIMLAISLVLMCLFRVPAWNVQWWCLLSVLLVLFYDGTRGKVNIKYLFYVYYPLHLAVLYGIWWIIVHK